MQRPGAAEVTFGSFNSLQKINMPADKVLYRPPEATYDKHGNPVICQGCQGTGYVGRTAVFTVLEKRETRTPDRGVVTMHIEVRNQHGDIAQTGSAKALVRRKDVSGGC